MNFTVNNLQEIAQIKSFLDVTIEENGNRKIDKNYWEVKYIIDGKTKLIADEIHLIMKSNSHSDNFMSNNEAWEMFKDSFFNGSTIFQSELDTQILKLANKVSQRLSSDYIKGINYFYGDVDDQFEPSENNELVLDELTGHLDWSGLQEITSILCNIAEYEQEQEEKGFNDLQEEEERKEHEIELNSGIEDMTRKITIHLDTIKYKQSLPPKFDNTFSLVEELTIIIELQERKLEYSYDLLEIKEQISATHENNAQIVRLKKEVSEEEKFLELLNNNKKTTIIL
jgi:hypothetical protein